MGTKIITPSLPENGRLFAVSDLHGHGHLLKRLLTQAGFSAEDTLVIDGDLVERGPDSLGTLRYAMELCRAGNAFALSGNWDYEMARMIRRARPEECWEARQRRRQWHESCLFDEMARELGFPLDGPRAMAKLLAEIPSQFWEELEFLESLPQIIVTPDYWFVHGGIPHENLAELAAVEPRALMKNDNFIGQGKSFSQYIVVGHWPATLYREGHPDFNPFASWGQKILSIDGGCGIKGDGQMNLVELSRESPGEFSSFSADDLPKIQALTAQAASGRSHYIHWGDNQVELLEEGEKYCRVSHKGYEMEIPAGEIYRDGDVVYSWDATDYRIAVEPGETLSLVSRTEKGALVKKNGVSGWYFGEYQPIK